MKERNSQANQTKLGYLSHPYSPSGSMQSENWSILQGGFDGKAGKEMLFTNPYGLTCWPEMEAPLIINQIEGKQEAQTAQPSSKTHKFRPMLKQEGDVIVGNEASSLSPRIEFLNQTLTIQLGTNSIVITPNSISITAPTITINGATAVSITGAAVTSNSLNLNTHRHTGVQPGAGNTGTPTP